MNMQDAASALSGKGNTFPPVITIALVSNLSRDRWPLISLASPTVGSVITTLHNALNQPLPPAEARHLVGVHRGGGGAVVSRLYLKGRQTCFGGLVPRPDRSGIYDIRFVDPPAQASQ